MKKYKFFLFLGLIINIIIFTMNLNNGHSWGDSALYFMQAESIIENNYKQLIINNKFTIERSSSDVNMGPVLYPWGFPLYLSFFKAIFGNNIILIKTYSIIPFISFLYILWNHLEKEFPNKIFIVIFLLFSFNMFFLRFSNHILADIPFLFISTIALFYIRNNLKNNNKVNLNRLTFINIILAIAISIRPNGVIIFITYLISSFYIILIKSNYNKETKIRMFFFNILITSISFTLLFFIISENLSPRGDSVLAILKTINLDTLKENLVYYFSLPHRFYDGLPFKELYYYTTLPFAILGACKRFKTDYVFVFYLILTIILYLLWPFKQGLRFLFPVLPFYIIFTYYGYHFFTSKYRIVKILIYIKSVVIIIAILLGSLNLSLSNLNNERNTNYGPYTKNSIELFDFIKKNISTDKVISFFKPRSLTMMTGNRSNLCSNTHDIITRSDYFCYYRGGPANYVKGSQINELTLDVLMNSSKVDLIFTNDSFFLFRISK